MKDYDDIKKEIWEMQQTVEEYLKTGNKALLNKKISFSSPVYNRKIEAYIQPISAQIFIDPYYKYEIIGYLIFKDITDLKNTVFICS